MPTKLDISNKPRVYGWSAIVEFTINSTGGFKELDGEKTSLLWSRDLILTLESRKIHPLLSGAGAKGYRMMIEAADTASDAEQLGLRLAHSLLSVAIERNWGMSLSWPDQPLPCRVVDRTASTGFTMSSFGSTTSHTDTAKFIDAIDEAFETDVPYRVLLSMELCASSRFENNNRTKLIMLVSAFEALAEQRDVSSELQGLVDRFISELKDSEVSESLKSSLKGQLENLKRESVRKAIRRFMGEMNLTDTDVKYVEHAYSARSKIVHEGKRVPELDAMINRLDQILRSVYKGYSKVE
ncbi:MAG: HEPN domain-containing protein [bacterium]|nr:HEPN domain-containing protein [bacterium]